MRQHHSTNIYPNSYCLLSSRACLSYSPHNSRTRGIYRCHCMDIRIPFYKMHIANYTHLHSITKLLMDLSHYWIILTPWGLANISLDTNTQSSWDMSHGMSYVPRILTLAYSQVVSKDWIQCIFFQLTERLCCILSLWPYDICYCAVNYTNKDFVIF